MHSIVQKIRKFDIVSFDIFDTLIYRNVSDFEEVFHMIEKKNDVEKRKITNFRKNRLFAESQCRKLTDKQEVTLKEIYDYLQKFYSKEICEYLKEIEIQFEIDLSEKNIKLYNVYQECLKLEKRVILTSDMYLPLDVIKKILDKNKITKYEKIFLSSEYLLTKYSGDLYDKILEELGSDKKSLIHIGDNIKSDFLRPKTKGINAIVISKRDNLGLHYGVHDISNCLLKKEYNNLCSFIGNKLSLKTYDSGNPNYYYGIGYETLGPLLHGYCSWLSKELKKCNIEKIFFLSRDGQIIQKVYENIYELDWQHEYIYVSRRALIVPTLWKCSGLSDITNTMFFQHLGTIEIFLNRIGLEPAEYQKTLKKYGFDLKTVYSYKALFKDKLFNLFFEEIFDKVKSNSQKEYDLLVRYLKQSGFEGRVAIIDIGWNGNMQKALKKVCEYAGIRVDIYGFYVGINPQAKDFVEHYNAQGYLFAPAYKKHLYKLQRNFTAIFEIFFSADHGSVLKYNLLNEEIVPVLLPYEYTSGENTSEDAYIITLIQKGGLDFCADLYHNKSLKVSIDPEVMFQNFINLGVRPNYEDAEKLGDLKHFDDSIIRIAAPREITRYICSPGLIITDLRQNLNIWKMGFFKRLFKINIPYYDIFRIIQCVMNAFGKKHFR